MMASVLNNLSNFYRIQFLVCVSKYYQDSQIVTQMSESYTHLNHQQYLQDPINPLGYLLPSDYEEVQQAILCARKYEANMTVLCGGHSFEKHGYGSDFHWVLYMRYFDRIHFDENRMQVKVGAGLRLEQIRDFLWEKGKYGLAFGGCPTVGVAGYTLGGGIGRASRKFGMMTDRVVEMDIAIAEGQILTVNKRHEPDLFWALRGAGMAGLGVVLSFTFDVIKIDYDVIQILIHLNVTDFKNVFGLWQEWITSNPEHAYCSYLWFSQQDSMLEFSIIEKDSDQREWLLQQLREVFTFITDDVIFYKNYTELFYPFDVDPIYHKTKSFFVGRALNETEVEKIQIALDEAIPAYVGIAFEAVGGKINEIPRNKTAYVHRNSFYHTFVSVTEEEETNLLSAYKVLDEFYESIVFASNGEAYQNAPDKDLVNWREEYYAENYAKLVAIKRRYDNRNFFKNQQSISL